MSQKVTGPQILAVVERARRKDPARPVILVKGSLATGLGRIGHENITFAVHETGSPLELRRIELASRDTEEPVVILTDLDESEVGTELRAKIAGERIWTPDRWEAVKTIFGVRSISHDLSKKKHLADALIEARPAEGYRAVRSSTLDLQTAVGALLRAQLGLSDSITTLERFISWIDADDEAPGKILAASAALNTDGHDVLDEQLERRFGVGALPVLTIVRAGRASEIIPLLFVGGAVHSGFEPDTQGAYALGLELELGKTPLEAAAWEAAASAAIGSAWSDGVTDSTRRAWSSAAEARLERYLVPHLAERSAAIASGFELILRQIGRELADLHKEPRSGAINAALTQSLNAAKAHKYTDPIRVERTEMAARLIRRGTGSIMWGSSLATAAIAYGKDGAWVDRARNAIARGESAPELATLYRSLGEEFTKARAEGNEAFAKIAVSAAKELPSDVTGIEDVLHTVVAPAAAAQPVLLLVFDGMGYESFTEVSPLFEEVGFTQYVDPEGATAKPCYAVLPTVTEYSRTSLLAGEVRRGNQDSEKRAFKEIPALVDVSKAGDPPVVHHKAALRDGGIDSIPDVVLNNIANDHQRVVAVVLNNIDERLKDVAGPVSTWGFPELHPLKWLLEAARDAGRIVIATSDHGHVLERGGEQRTVKGGRERWRSVECDPNPEPDEVVVEGKRVVAEGQRAILPFAEQVRFDGRRNGYHGGLCPQEVLVPIGVYAANDTALDGWSSTALPTPGWWFEFEDETSTATGKAPAKRKTKASPTSSDAPTLFPVEEPDDDSGLQPAGASNAWVRAALEALEQYRRPQIRLTPDEAGRLLAALDRNGNLPMPLDRLAAATQLPASRIARYVSQLQQLVNIDGYGILTMIGEEVRFDRGLLDTQLEL